MRGTISDSFGMFHGLSKDSLEGLLHHPFSSQGPLVFSVCPTQASEVPALRYLKELLNQIPSKGLKLTKKENLPLKQLLSCLQAAEGEAGFSELMSIKEIRSEDEVQHYALLREFSSLVGWTKVEEGRLYLTGEGCKTRDLENWDMLYPVILENFWKKTNWTFVVTTDFAEIQLFAGCLIYLLLLYGDQPKSPQMYGTMLMKAFPELLEASVAQNADNPEFFVLSLIHLVYFHFIFRMFGLIEHVDISEDLYDVRTTGLFQRLVSLNV